MTKLYYEAHVTIEPVFDDRLEVVTTLSKAHGFKVANLLMKKRKEDTEEQSQYDTFTTSRSKSYEDIKYRMMALIKSLKSDNFKVWRYKIEDTLMDSKIDDVLDLIVK